MSRTGWPWLGTFEPHPDLAAFRPVIGERGMVSSPHATASRIGLDVLRRGGNAVDAAIAASAALMVVCPMQCGPGGDAFWMIATAEGNAVALDASGPAPALADAEALRAAGHTAIPARSGWTVTTPGAIDGWAKAHERFGSLPLDALIEPAAALAEVGFPASRHTVASFLTAEGDLRRTEALPLWSRSGDIPDLYQKICQPALAATLRAIAATAGRAFYEGPLAAEIAAAARASSGWLSEQDLASYSAEWISPVRAPFRDLIVCTTPPSTQGFALLAALRRVEAVSPAPLDWQLPAAAHLLIEAVAAGLTLRDAQNQDRRRIGEPLASLWAPASAAAFAASFDPARRSRTAALPSARVTKGDTANLTVVDGAGLCVSLTQSLFFDFGTCIPVPTGGFTLHNRGAAFQLDPEAPGALKAGDRPPSTLMPTIVFRDGQPILTLGCMGGDGQMQSQLQMLIDIHDSGLDPQQAVSRPRWYLDRSDAGGARVKVEAGISADIVEALRAKGHVVDVLGKCEEIMGHVQVIQGRDGVLVGAADPRSDGQVTAF